MRRDFEVRLQDLLLSGPVSMREVAERIDKRYSTLMRELSPWDKKAKLGLTTAIAIIRATGDQRILDLILEECGTQPADPATATPEGQEFAPPLL